MHCGSEVQLRAEHCPSCGTRVVVDFDTIADSVQGDFAERRAEQIVAALKRVLLLLLIAGAVIYSFNDLFDKPLVYDGAGLPAITASGNVTLDLPSVRKPYIDPRHNAVLPAPRRTAWGYRTSPIKERLRSAARADVAPAKKTVNTAINDGLKFLALSQNADGSWGVLNYPKKEWEQWNTAEYQWGNVGVTALGLLAFLGEGETWQEDRGPKIKSIYGDRVKKAVRFLVLSQDQATGRFGTFEGDQIHHMYNQGMATLAICEAAGLSGDEHLRDVAQRGIDYIVKTQTPRGGWNYHGKTAGNDDTSVSAWQVQALMAGKEAGLQVPAETIQKALEMYQKATQPEGFVRYELGTDDREDLNRVSLCGIALMIRQMLGEDARTPVFQKLAVKLSQSPPEANVLWGGTWRPKMAKNDDTARAQYDPYKIYFATYGLYFMGGRDWEQWHNAMKQAALAMQSSDGSWRTNDPWSYCGGCNYSTAMSILTLQVYYRLQ